MFIKSLTPLKMKAILVYIFTTDQADNGATNASQVGGWAI